MFSKHYLFSDDQLELADHFQKLLQSNASMRDVRRIFEGTDPYHLDLWKKMAEGGWLGLITDEKYGGSGLAMDDLCLLGREIGKTLAPLPFLGHVCLATQALCVAGSESNKKEYLKRFSDGSLLATLAFREAAQDDWRKTPSATVNNNYLTGKKIAVPNGACADTVIVSACDLDSEDGENISLYLADLNASSITRTKSDTIDPASNYASVDFNSTKVTRLHDDDLSSAVFEQIIYRATIVNAFIQSGSAESAFEMARNYSLERVAFGRQIGSFQAIKHKLARMYESQSIAQANCQFGAWAIKQNSPLLGLAAASSHLAASESFNHCAAQNNRIHGGISATWEHDCHLYYRRAKLSSLILGSSITWNNILVENLHSNSAELSIDFSDMNGQQTNQQLRRECRTWINQNRPDLSGVSGMNDDERFEFVLNWHKLKARAGWACPQWPEEYGGSAWTPDKMALWQQEEGEEMRDLCFGLSIVDIAGPVLMSCSSDAQKSRYLPTMLSGEEFWCMLFSEPHGGSDVAALRTRAVKDGDEWIVNGQKVWTSNAHHADFGLLIARTDSTVPKHKGLTYFILDMHAPGVVIRPLKQITGNSEFCEVFFDDVRIPDSNRMGELGGGWKIIMATLANEKAALRSFQIHLKKFLHAIEELDIDGLAAIEHPLVQEKIKQINNKYWAVRFIEFQNLHNAVNKEQPGHEEVISKLLVASTNLDLAGFVIDLYNSKCFENDTRKSATLKFFEYVYFHFIGVSMGGGTEEILLNLIGDYLGLPAEPRVDKDIPFNQLQDPTRT